MKDYPIYDLFYRLLDPSDLSFLTEEIRLTDTAVHEYITNIRQAEAWEVGETTSDYFIFYEDPSGEKFHKVDDLTTVSPGNTSPTQLGGIHRFGATFTDGEIRELSVSNFLNGSDSETPIDQLGIAIKGPVTNSSFEVSLDGNSWSAVALADQEMLHLDQNATIRFVPDGTPGDFGLNYFIWDKSNGLASGSVTEGLSTTGGTSAYSTGEAQLRIQVTEATGNPIGQIIDQNTDANQVQENSAVGTAVGITASATDADAADNVTYSLSDDAGGLFSIGETSGEVTVNGSLDYEAVGGDSHDITVLATSDDGSASSRSFTISVTDDPDEHDVSAISDINYNPELHI